MAHRPGFCPKLDRIYKNSFAPWPLGGKSPQVCLQGLSIAWLAPRALTMRAALPAMADWALCVGQSFVFFAWLGQRSFMGRGLHNSLVDFFVGADPCARDSELKQTCIN